MALSICFVSLGMAQNVKEDAHSERSIANDSMESVYQLSDEKLVSYLTAEQEPLHIMDFSIADMLVNTQLPPMYEQSEHHIPYIRTVKQGAFVIYEGEGASYTLYEGDGTFQKEDALRYSMKKGDVAQIHIASDAYTTYRGLKVGDQRGGIILLYGMPQAIWRDSETHSTIYWYRKSSEEGAYGLAFTVHDLKIVAIDVHAPGVEAKGYWPNFTERMYAPGELRDEDFSLAGYKLYEVFTPAKGLNSTWQASGEIWHQNYIAMQDATVLYDEDMRISKVFLPLNGGVTRRGIGVGANKLLMLKVYGVPTKVVKEFAFKLDAEQVVYEYKNPYAVSEYLLFVVNEKDHFIDSIILSDRAAEDIRDPVESLTAKKLVYGRMF